MTSVIASEASVFASETLAVLALIVIIGPLLAEKARLPGLIGFMLGGTLLGPFGLGVLDTGQFDTVGALGILYLMFLAGLELDMDTFTRYRRAAIQFGLLTFGFPFALGWWGGLQLGYGVESAVLLGSVWASHTLVALPIVKRAGLSGSRSVAVAAGATILTDTLALLVLAVISSGAGGEGQQGGGEAMVVVRLLIGLAVLAAATLFVIPWVGRWFFGGPGTDRLLRFMFLLGAMALGSLVAEWGGIEGIVGAFFAGLGLNRLVPKRSGLMEKVEFVGSTLFIPAFLVSVGMLIDPSLLFDLSTLSLAGAFLLIIGVGKALAAGAGGGLFRFTLAEIGVLFSLTLGQAAATFAAVLVGVDLGLFDVQVLNAVVLAVLVTVVMSSVLTRLFSGLVEPEQTLIQPVGLSVVVPVPAGAEIGPVLHIAGQIARADTGTVTPLVVIPTELATAESSEEAEVRAEEAAEMASTSGAEAEGLIRVDGSIKDAVLSVVAERRASLVVLSAPLGSRLSQVVFGGPIERIGGQSPVPVILTLRVEAAPERLVVVIPGRPRTIGDQVDSQVAVDVVSRIHSSSGLPLTALIGMGGVVPDLPEGTTIEQTPALTAASINATITSGDLIVAPLTSVRRFLNVLNREARLPAGVGMLITAGPFRLRAEGTGAEDVSSILGYSAR
ncbi:MAG: cation:proton antiporter [Acidimicrobiia bacterium]